MNKKPDMSDDKQPVISERREDKRPVVCQEIIKDR